MSEIQLKVMRDLQPNGNGTPAYVNPNYTSSTEAVSTVSGVLHGREDSGDHGPPNGGPSNHRVHMEGTEEMGPHTKDTEAEEDREERGCSKKIGDIQERFTAFSTEYSQQIKMSFCAILLAGFAVYFAFAMRHSFGDEGSIRLLVMTSLVVFLTCISLIKKYLGGSIYSSILKPMAHGISSVWPRLKWVIYFVIIAGLITFLVVEVGLNNPYNLVSCAGYVFFIVVLFIFSKNPAKVKWRPVIWGLGLQFVFAAIIIKTQWGCQAFDWMGERVREFIAHTDAGAKFVFGDKYTDHFFAFKVLPVVIFFSSFISVMYYLGAMQVLITKMAWGMQVTMGTTAAESMNAAANIFLGQTEAPLLIRPMLPHMTQSEIHAVMTGGFASIAGSVMATFILLGVPANHLISASVMAAPAALAMSKLFCPETEDSKTTSKHISAMEHPPERNIIEAASNGASAAISLVANIAANLIAFMALLAFVNATLKWFGERIGMQPPDYPDLSFQLIFSYVLWPVAFVMGIPTVDCRKVAELMGVKLFLNEFVAYTELSRYISNTKEFAQYTQLYNGTGIKYIQDDIYLEYTNQTLIGGTIEARTEVLSTYALCGFANLGSIGSVIASLGAMAPSRKSEAAMLGMRAMICGTVASYMNTCVAGIMFEGATDRSC